MKKITLLFLAVIFADLVAAQGFAVVPEERQKRTFDLNAEFNTGFVNIGDASRTVELSYPESKNYNIDLNRTKFELRPSKIVSEPQNEGRWFSLGSRYAKIRQTSFDVNIYPNSTKRNISIPLTVVSTVKDESGFQDIGQKVYQERELDFRVYTDSEIIDTKDPIYEEGALFNSTEGESNERSGLEAEEKNSSTQGSIQGSKKGLTGQTQEVNREINKWTLVFLLGIVISVFVVLREI